MHAVPLLLFVVQCDGCSESVQHIALTYDVIEAHGYCMRYKLIIVSIHVAEVQVVKHFGHGGLRQFQLEKLFM